MNQNNDNPEGGSPAFAPDQKLAGVYILRKELLSDGSDRIWLAHDEVLGKDVSLHFIPPALRNDERALGELRQEIKRNRQLIHPGILRVYDLIEEADWTAISMDWFEGESLASQLRARGQGGFEPKEIEGWLRQVCQTLEDVHRIHIVHRNLSPRNLFVDAAGKVLIAKFGVSRVIEDALGRLQKSEGNDWHLPYLSPQQLDGESPNKLDDIYALGASIHELLTDQPLFSGGDLVSQIRRSAPPTLGERRAAGSAPIPEAWEKTVAASLAKVPTERPQTAGEVSKRMELGSAGRSVSPAPGVAAGAGAVAAAAVPKTPRTPKPVETLAKKVAAMESAKSVIPVDRKKEAEPAEAEIFSKSPAHSASGPGLGTLALAGLAIFIGLIYFFGSHKSSTPGSEPTPSAAPSLAGEAPVNQPESTPMPAVSTPRPVVSNPTPAMASIKPMPSGPMATHGATPSEQLLGEPNLASKGMASPSPAKAPPAVLPPPATPFQIVSNKPVTTPTPAPMAMATPAPLITMATPAPAAVATPAPKVAAEPTPTPKPLATPRVATAPATSAPSMAVGGMPALPPMQKPASPEKAREAVAMAEKAYQDALKQKQSSEAAVAASQQGLDDRTKANVAIFKSAEDLQSQRQQKTETVKAAEDAARTAHQAAEEQKRLADLKARELEEAQKTMADWESKNKAKLAERDQAKAGADALQKALDEKKQAAADAAKALMMAEAIRDRSTAAVAVADQDAAAAKAAADRQAEEARVAAEKRAADDKAAAERKAAEEIRLAAQRKDEERSNAKAKLQQEMDEMLQKFKQQMAQLDSPENPAPVVAPATTPTPAPIATPTPAPTPKGKGKNKNATPTPKPAAQAATPPPATVPKIAVSELPLPAGSDPTDIPFSSLPPVSAPAPLPAAVAPAPMPTPASAPAPVELAMNTQPTPAAPKNPTLKEGPDSSKATYAASVGLKFAPVGDVLVSIFPVRVQDFEVFAKETGYKSTGWRNPGFKQAPDHPVVNVSWNDATAFCKWLTDRDHKRESLGKDQVYRLPTDLEWSAAVGLNNESGKTPEQRDMGVSDVFPWGTQWPPPPGAGNYTGEETGSDVAIKGYDDGFAWTSPVGSFPANKNGLYDMGGNVWQWCQDDWNADSKAKVLRGASWYNGALKLSLLSSCRVHAKADSSTDNYGFRIVRASETTGKKLH